MNATREFLRAAHAQFQSLYQRSHNAFFTKRSVQSLWLIGMCAVAGLTVLTILTSAKNHRDKWTSSQQVVVATTDIDAGAQLGAHNTNIVSMPSVFTPDDVLTAVPENASMRISVSARTPLTSSVVTVNGDLSAIPAGWRIVALPRSMPTPPLVVGDAIDVVGGTTIITTGAIVASLEPLTIGVPADAAAAVAASARLGEISLVQAR